MASEPAVSPDFPYVSRYLEVLGSRIHYIDEGSGQPVLFLHANPTSSYLWRNIIPYLSDTARCIAPDLIGMGRSDKPDIAYRFFDHARYLDVFIEQLGLRDITLVLHDWGSGLGFHYAARNPDNVRALAFMEAIVKPSAWGDFPAEFKMGFRMFRTPVLGWIVICVMNVFVNKLLPGAVVRPLTGAEMARYREPYPDVRSRRPVHRWPNEIPIDGRPADVQEAVAAYSDWLTGTERPKLLFYAHPGGIIREKEVAWCRQHLKNLTTVDIGRGIHYLQEDNPHLIGEELAQWHRSLGERGPGP